ncbi:Ubiquitin--protein ligase [Bertholletia excelsa]
MARSAPTADAENHPEIEESATGRVQFRQFDIADDESDHHFLNWNRPRKASAGDPADCFSDVKSGVHKKIMKEWRVLERNLPEKIYVRVYERRIDLLRAVIVGPPGTPYHDGLFFFDLAFPSDYPNRPPQVSYRSFGLRINPNLYPNGIVCLSLLNTWFGRKNEKWNPAESTVLQVLVSIQGLVLNQEPYFNEPGVSIFPGRAKKSMAYNENAFIMSCKTMVYLLRNPPRNFSDFVNSHFRERAASILEACNAYREGWARVGCYCLNESDPNSNPQPVVVSSSFKATMKSWYEEMLLAFRMTGASLDHFVEQLRTEKRAGKEVGVGKRKKKKKKSKTTSSELIPVKKKICAKTPPLRTLAIKGAKSGIRKVIIKIKKVLGLEKVGKKNADRIKVTPS